MQSLPSIRPRHSTYASLTCKYVGKSSARERERFDESIGVDTVTDEESEEEARCINYQVLMSICSELMCGHCCITCRGQSTPIRTSASERKGCEFATLYIEWAKKSEIQTCNPSRWSKKPAPLCPQSMYLKSKNLRTFLYLKSTLGFGKAELTVEINGWHWVFSRILACGISP